MKNELSQSFDRSRNANHRLQLLIANAVEFNQKLQNELCIAMIDTCCREGVLAEWRQFTSQSEIAL